MISTVKAYSPIGFAVVPELPRTAVILVLLNLLPPSRCQERWRFLTEGATMSGIRDLLVVYAFVLAFSVVADADELRPARLQGIDPARAAAPAVEVDHGPRVGVPSLADETIADVPIWRTVTLGSYKAIDALRDALHAKRIRVDDTADELLSRPTFDLSKTARDARLVVLAVSELGFEEAGASLAEIYARARQLGFELCPAEVGPQLRLQYLDQPLGEFLHIAMAPIARYGVEPTDFTVANGGGGLILIAGDAHPKFIMPSTMRFVFVGPKAPQRREINRPGLVSAASVAGHGKVESQ